MYKVLKNMTLVLAMCSLCMFLVSCDDEGERGLDYEYDGISSLPMPEVDLATAQKIQRSGKVEDIELGEAKIEPEVLELEDLGDVPDSLPAGGSSPTDPNFM